MLYELAVAILDKHNTAGDRFKSVYRTDIDLRGQLFREYRVSSEGANLVLKQDVQEAIALCLRRLDDEAMGPLQRAGLESTIRRDIRACKDKLPAQWPDHPFCLDQVRPADIGVSGVQEILTLEGWNLNEVEEVHLTLYGDDSVVLVAVLSTLTVEEHGRYSLEIGVSFPQPSTPQTWNIVLKNAQVRSILPAALTTYNKPI